MVYIKVDGDWYLAEVEDSYDLSGETYNLCQIVFDPETDQIESMAEFDPVAGDWTSNINITLEQVKLEIFLQKGQFMAWSEALYRRTNSQY